jgi:ADP-ribose pyrophosphatase
VTKGFRRLSEREVWKGHVVSVAVATIEAPDGSTFEREVVHHPGAVAVVPLLDDGRTALLVRQYRAALDEVILELPAGKLDVDGEDPEAAAVRELAEEIGRRPTVVEELGRFYNTPGFCDERGILYLATGLVEVPTSAQGIEETHMTVEEVDLDEVPAMVADGRLQDGKSIIGLLLARERLRS